MQNLKYEARLEALGIISLEERRRPIRNDLITCYKYLNNKCEIGNLDSLCVSGITQTRGHPMKLTRSLCRTGWLLNSFENRAVTVWNSLPCHIVCSPSVVSFKKIWKIMIYLTFVLFSDVDCNLICLISDMFTKFLCWEHLRGHVWTCVSILANLLLLFLYLLYICIVVFQINIFNSIQFNTFTLLCVCYVYYGNYYYA